MTVREKVEHILTEKGMFQGQAEKVMAICIPKINKISDDYQIEWDEDCDFYNEDMYDFMFSIVKPEALKWIEERIPFVWFKGNFED